MDEFELIKKNIEKDIIATENYKTKLASEIRNGLGSQIKKNLGKVNFIKQPKQSKLITWLKRIFTAL